MLPVPPEEPPEEEENGGDAAAAAREEQEAEKVFNDLLDQYGFGILWDVCSHLLFFLAIPLDSKKTDYTSPFVICQMCYSLILGSAYGRYGTVGILLGKHVETTSWALLWFLGFFLCLATDAESMKFMNARFPGEPPPLASFPFVVFPGQIFVWYLMYGPTSFWLFPARHIVWYLKKGGDRVYFYSKLSVLVAIDVWLYVFCKYRDTKFNDKNKTFAEVADHLEDAFLVKYTLEKVREVPSTLYAGFKWAVILDIMLVYVLPAAIGAAAVIFVQGTRLLRRNRVHTQRMFLGYPGVHLD